MNAHSRPMPVTDVRLASFYLECAHYWLASLMEHRHAMRRQDRATYINRARAMRMSAELEAKRHG